MRIVLQRVSSASVSVDGREVSRIAQGLLLLIGIEAGDDEQIAVSTASKISGLRIFDDSSGKMNLSLAEVSGEVLVVSQFTLMGSVRRGRRPSFDRAAKSNLAEPIVEALATNLEALGLRVARGRFGARMEVELVNDGPVTLVMDF